MATIAYKTGNLLDSKAQMLVNTVNCVGVMGKGLALEFRNRFPSNYEAYRFMCKKGLVEIGTMLVTITPGSSGPNPRFLCNFPTKEHWRNPSKLTYIKRGLAALARSICFHKVRSIAIPPLGCGNGGLDWQTVLPMILAAMEPIDVEVEIFGSPP